MIGHINCEVFKNRAMTVCCLCGKDKKMTREHIWNNSLVALFDDAPLTIDERHGKIYLAPPIVKDICEECNQALSPCDEYMTKFAGRYLRKQLSGSPVSIDLLNLSRWVLKTGANHSRSAHEHSEWWKKYRSFLRFGGSAPDVDIFAASWHDPRPLDLQRLVPVPALGARSVSLHALSNPPWKEISEHLNGGWALKVGSAVFAFIDWEPGTPESIRYSTRDTIRGYGWSLLGIDVFLGGFPFNEYTCVFYNIISDPSKPLALNGLG